MTSKTKSKGSDTSLFNIDNFLAETKQLGTSMQSCVLGIDEAGRGPALGDMVYSGAIIPLTHYARMCDTGVDDSKKLTEVDRENIRAKLEKDIPECIPVPVVLSADDISGAMFSRTENLNTISHNAAIEIIHRATILAKGTLAAVYVDTVGPPETYQKKLKGRFPFLHIVVAKKADSLYPVVSAASIFAKTTRDRNMISYEKIDKTLDFNDANSPALKKRTREGDSSSSGGVQKLGSGYPADPYTIKWLDTYLHPFAGYTADFVRFSWAPVQERVKNHCLPMAWEHETARVEEVDYIKDGELKKKKTKVKENPLGAPLPPPPSGLRPQREILCSSMLGVENVIAASDSIVSSIWL